MFLIIFIFKNSKNGIWIEFIKPKPKTTFKDAIRAENVTPNFAGIGIRYWYYLYLIPTPIPKISKNTRNWYFLVLVLTPKIPKFGIIGIGLIPKIPKFYVEKLNYYYSKSTVYLKTCLNKKT